MLISVKYVRTDIKTVNFLYTHRLVDSDYIKDFMITAGTALSMTDQQIEVTNGILDFLYDNYRSTRECPFKNIQRLYDSGGIQYSDSVVRKTDFYRKHKKVMEKILRPIAIAPYTTNDYFGADFSYGSTSAATYGSTMYTYMANTATYTTIVNAAYPAGYITIDVG